MRLALAVCCVCLLMGCDGEEPKVDPAQRDVGRLVTAVGDVVYQCRAVQAGFVDRIDSRAVKRDVDFLVAAWDRLRPDSRFDTGTGPSTLRRQSKLAIRRLRPCAPEQADRLREAMDS